MKRVCVVLVLIMIISLTGGCSNSTTLSSETVVATESTEVSSPADAYMDDYALDIVKEACQARWDNLHETKNDYDKIFGDGVNGENDELYGDTKYLKKLYIEYNQIEYDTICNYTSDNFKDSNFKDEKLKKYMIAYAEAVENQLELCKHTDFSITEEINKYAVISAEKCQTVLDIIENYDLDFDSEYASEKKALQTTVDNWLNEE